MSADIVRLFLPALPTGAALRPYDRELNIKLKKWSDEVTDAINTPAAGSVTSGPATISVGPSSALPAAGSGVSFYFANDISQLFIDNGLGQWVAIA